MKKVGFTLAEVLIVLGIIGVVAALTIPALITNYKAIQLHSRFKKSYSTLSQVMKLAQEDDVVFEEYSYGSPNRLDLVNTFKKYLTGVVDCSLQKNKQLKTCLMITYGHKDDYKYGYKSLKSTEPDLTNQSLFDDGELLLQDGSLLFFNADGAMVGVSVDINGILSPPNRWGYDLFTFQIVNGNLIPAGAQGAKYTDKNTYCSLTSNNKMNGIGCAAYANNLDYFKWIVRNVK